MIRTRLHTLYAIYKSLKKEDLSAQQLRKIRFELELSERDGDHQYQAAPQSGSLYSYHDQQIFEPSPTANLLALSSIQSLDYLLERDKQREKDGFPRKIRVGKMVKPSLDGVDKVVIVPTTVEEKFIHDKIRLDEEGGEGGDGDPASGDGGTGEGEEGRSLAKSLFARIRLDREAPVRVMAGGMMWSPMPTILAASSQKSLSSPTSKKRARNVHLPGIPTI
jgi:hypothetical protein